MESNIQSIPSVINELLGSDSKREVLIVISNDEFLRLFEVMKDAKYLANHITKSISGINGNISSFNIDGNIFHFKIKS